MVEIEETQSSPGPLVTTLKWRDSTWDGTMSAWTILAAESDDYTAVPQHLQPWGGSHVCKIDLEKN